MIDQNQCKVIIKLGYVFVSLQFIMFILYLDRRQRLQFGNFGQDKREVCNTFRPQFDRRIRIVIDVVNWQLGLSNREKTKGSSDCYSPSISPFVLISFRWMNHPYVFEGLFVRVKHFYLSLINMFFWLSLSSLPALSCFLYYPALSYFILEENLETEFC